MNFETLKALAQDARMKALIVKELLAMCREFWLKQLKEKE